MLKSGDIKVVPGEGLWSRPCVSGHVTGEVAFAEILRVGSLPGRSRLLNAPLTYVAGGARVTFPSTPSIPGMVRPWPKLPSLSPPTASCLRDIGILVYQTWQSYSQTLERAASSIHLHWQSAHIRSVSEGLSKPLMNEPRVARG